MIIFYGTLTRRLLWTDVEKEILLHLVEAIFHFVMNHTEDFLRVLQKKRDLVAGNAPLAEAATQEYGQNMGYRASIFQWDMGMNIRKMSLWILKHVITQFS